MLKIIRLACACLFMLWLPALQAADSGWLQNPANDHAKVRLRADTSQPGETRLLLSVELQKGWKTYWRSPGEGGIAPAIVWQGNPPPATWHWPTPQRFEVAGISTQGYHDRVTLPIVMPGQVSGPLAGTLTLSTCSNVCILTDYPFSLDLTTPNDPLFNHDFAQAMGQVPIAAGLAESVKAGYRSGELQISAERAAGWQQPALFFDTLADADLGKPQVETDGAQLLARVPVSDGWGDAAPDLRGKTLTLVIDDGGMAQQITLPIGDPLAAPAGAAFPLWQAVLMALAGGLILNLMPCVLPVLGIKLGSILQVEHRDRRSVRLQFLASSLGIVASFMALALLMTLLRLGNHALGWGIQFQNPWFIGFMVLVTLLFSANLFGLFHLRLSSDLNTSLARSERPFLAGRVRYATGDAVLGAVSRHGGGLRAGGVAAGAVGHVHRTRHRHEPAVAADCRLAFAGAALAAPRPLDEYRQAGDGVVDAGVVAVAAEPAEQSYRRAGHAVAGGAGAAGVAAGSMASAGSTVSGQAGGGHVGAGWRGLVGRLADRRPVAPTVAGSGAVATAERTGDCRGAGPA